MPVVSIGNLGGRVDNGQGHQHAHRSLDLSKPLLIIPREPIDPKQLVKHLVVW
jgi:hypothetical protein